MERGFYFFKPQKSQKIYFNRLNKFKIIPQNSSYKMKIKDFKNLGVLYYV